MCARTVSPQETSEKRRTILAAARRLLIARGYHDIVLDDVAREAGVAKGTLFLYFRSKEDLFSAVFEELVDQLGEALEALAASGRKGRDLLQETVRTILSHFGRNFDFVSQFSSGRLAGCGARSCGRILEKFQANYLRVVRILRACAEAGVVDPARVDFSAAAMFGLCRTAAMRQILRGLRAPLERQTGQVVDFFLNGASGKRVEGRR